MFSSKVVNIVGGGVGGLWAARELAIQGWHVRVFERERDLGGLAGSIELAGETVDKYYHFNCKFDIDWLAGIAGTPLNNEFAWHNGTTANFVNGNLYRFSNAVDLLRFKPFTVLERLLMGLFSYYCRFNLDWKKLDAVSAYKWLTNHLGDKIYSILFRPLLRFKFDAWEQKISAAWMWHRLHRVALSRTGVFGREEYGRLLGGMKVLVNFLEAEIVDRGGEIHTDEEILSIDCKYDRAIGVTTRKGIYPSNGVVAVLPIPELRHILPRQYADLLPQILYCGVHCLTLAFRRPITKHFWVNLCRFDLPFNGIICPSNLGCAVDRPSIIYIPFYRSSEDPLFTASTLELWQLVRNPLQYIFPEAKDSNILDIVSSKSKYAQPLFPVGFAGNLPTALPSLKAFKFFESAHLYPEDRTISGTIRAVGKLFY